ncbi:S41 family peptidase [Holospora curviuscula]|uniref:Tricorn protease homolog n=1 Tax=Holospora curviuscula TaxID=1082868 RepID=A0A2S5RHX4_9PROT|nr:S41 family peptidase [Holospora curviuscula]PPE06910.1 hypothetical protein HCUR_00062 [Holospora curviuscula]
MSVYIRYPSACQSLVAFVLGNSVWTMTLQERKLTRITGNLSDLGALALHPRGIAWSSDGQVFLQWHDQCSPEQLTYSSVPVYVLGWYQDHIVIRSGLNHPFKISELFLLCPHSKQWTPILCGEANAISWGTHGRCVIQRAGYRYGAWQRYQGGAVGQLWVDIQGDKNFTPLLSTSQYNYISPVCIEERIFFLSDVSGWGNVHSVLWDGSDMRQHTTNHEFYPMHLTGTQDHLMYTVGGALHVLSLKEETIQEFPVPLRPSNLEEGDVLYDSERYYRASALSTKAKHLAVITRGRLFQMTLYKGPVWQLPYGRMPLGHYRCLQWLSDEELITVCDEGKRDVLHLFQDVGGPEIVYTWNDFSGVESDWGRIVTMKAHPKKRRLVLSNHRHELFWVDLEEKIGSWIETASKDFTQKRGEILGISWSPCGQGIAYGLPHKAHTSSIIIYDTLAQRRHVIVEDMFENVAPVFDPKGRYLFFFSARHLESALDPVHFSSQFEAPLLPFVVTLLRDTPSLLYAALEEPLCKEESDSQGEKKTLSSQETSKHDKDSLVSIEGYIENDTTKTQEKVDHEMSCTTSSTVQELCIDFEDIHLRIHPLPIPPRPYTQLVCLEDGILYSTCLEHGLLHSVQKPEQKLWRYSFSDLTETSILDSVQEWSISSDQKWMLYLTQGRLRTIRAGTKPDEGEDHSFRMGGWLDWQRIPLRVCHRQEWRQMFDEAWRLQKDLFWRSDLGGVDWDTVYERYRPLVERITQVEDLWAIIEEMHGELGTSHAYVIPSKESKNFSLSATLGASFSYVKSEDAYRIEKFLIQRSGQSVPLQRPGLSIKPGDLVWSIGGQRLSQSCPPEQVLWGRAGYGTPIEVGSKNEERRSVVVFPEKGFQEHEWRYESWIAEKTSYVHEQTEGKLGYIHIPNMGCEGMDVFMRSYLQEFDRPGLIIDVRFNGGGNVSEIIFRYLTQKRLGYDQSRWSGVTPYPSLSPRGPMVVLINGYTGSDGDMFAYAFKSWNLGKVIGKRTWGGVVGICPRYPLLNGAYTTQPEYAIWFPEAGWSLENRGVHPDIEVDITPQDQILAKDPQLDRGIFEALKAVEQDQERQHRLMPKNFL